MVFAKGWSRGHRIVQADAKTWYVPSTGMLIEVGTGGIGKLPCKRCGRMPTKEGYDACLGHIDNCNSACCGHGSWRGCISINNDNGDEILCRPFLQYNRDEVNKLPLGAIWPRHIYREWSNKYRDE